MPYIIAVYLTAFPVGIFCLIAAFQNIDNSIIQSLPLQCIFSGCIGGVLYCLRSIYINKCAKNDWDNNWNIWYIIRPIASSLSGGVSYLFLKAGLIILDATTKDNPSTYGYLAFAFIAGLNVDGFTKKIEEIANSTWGIRKSRLGSDTSQPPAES